MNNEKPSYSKYLQLNKILESQKLRSDILDKPVHDEMLFIIIHQIYELWFKQIIHEINSIIDYLNDPHISESDVNIIVTRLIRINDIQDIAIKQIDILNSMTPMDFLEFRDLLNPASGFQSVQFRVIENALGLKRATRLKFSKQDYTKFLSDNEVDFAEKYENKPNLFDLVESWLERTPFLEEKNFSFWKSYKKAIKNMIQNDINIINNNENLDEESKNDQLNNYKRISSNYDSLFDENKYNQLIKNGSKKLSQKASHAALFIMLYRNEPILQTPYRLITKLIDIDQSLNSWRYKHALLAQRMIGVKIGSGGSSGYSYLQKTLEKHSIFDDYANLSTYLIPKTSLPELPLEIRNKLGYFYNKEYKNGK